MREETPPCSHLGSSAERGRVRGLVTRRAPRRFTPLLATAGALCAGGQTLIEPDEASRVRSRETNRRPVIQILIMGCSLPQPQTVVFIVIIMHKHSNNHSN